MAGKSPVQIVKTGWVRLQRALALNSKAAQESHVKVGIIASKGGSDTHSNGLTLIEMMAIHELGSPAAGIPQRSSIRSTFARNDVRTEMGALTAKIVTKVIHGMRLEQGLGLLGAWGVAQIKSTIKERKTEGPDSQANAPATIKRKGSDLPLVDTGRLINAMQWLVWLGRARDESGRFAAGGKIDL